MKIAIEIDDFVVEEIVARDLRLLLERGALPEDMREHFEKVLAWYEFTDSEN